MLISALQKIGYPVVKPFRTGEKLLDEVMDDGIDLVVTWRDLPRMSEFDLVHGVQSYASQVERSIPVILAGTDFKREDVLEAISAGAHQIVVLPVSEQDLEIKIEAAREMAK